MVRGQRSELCRQILSFVKAEYIFHVAVLNTFSSCIFFFHHLCGAMVHEQQLLLIWWMKENTTIKKEFWILSFFHWSCIKNCIYFWGFYWQPTCIFSKICKMKCRNGTQSCKEGCEASRWWILLFNFFYSNCITVPSDYLTSFHPPTILPYSLTFSIPRIKGKLWLEWTKRFSSEHIQFQLPCLVFIRIDIGRWALKLEIQAWGSPLQCDWDAFPRIGWIWHRYFSIPLLRILYPTVFFLLICVERKKCVCRKIGVGEKVLELII